MPFTSTQARKLAETLLTDEEGISEEAYELLYKFMQHFGIEDLDEEVDAIDGRFFIPIDEDEEEKFVDDRVL